MRTRSPSPARPARVSARRALGEAEAGHLGEAARDQGGAGVLAEPAALDDAAGDGEHVLDRAADLGAGDVVGQIGAEAGPGDARDEPLAQRPVLDRQRHRGRQAGGDFVGEGGAGQDRDRRRRAAPRARPRASAGRSHPRSPWRRARAACRPAARPPSTARKCCAGVTMRKASQPPRSARSPVARIAGRSFTPLRKSAFSWRGVDRLDHFGLARPEQDLLAARRPRPGRARCPRRRRR